LVLVRVHGRDLLVFVLVLVAILAHVLG
jgi:hypothetical protein